MAESERESRRTQYTKRVIKEALFELLDEKDRFDAISVTDICKRADINRSTFYSHYEDKYDLLRVLVREALEEDPAARLVDTPLCQRLPADECMRKLFRDPSLGSYIAECILQLRRDEVVPKFMQQFGLDEEEATYLFLFTVNGSLAVNRALDWGFGERWDKIQHTIGAFVEGGELRLAEGR